MSWVTTRALSLSIVASSTPASPRAASWIHICFLNWRRVCSWVACTISWPSTMATSSSSRSFEQTAEDVDRVVAHGEGVPLAVVDHVDAEIPGVEVGRARGRPRSGARAPPRAPRRRGGRRSSRAAPSSFQEPAGLHRPLLGGVRGAFTSPSNIAAPLGLASSSRATSTPPASRTPFALISYPMGSESTSLDLPLELQLGGGGDLASFWPSADQHVALPPLEVAVDLLLLGLRCGGRRAEGGEREQGQGVSLHRSSPGR